MEVVGSSSSSSSSSGGSSNGSSNGGGDITRAYRCSVGVNLTGHGVVKEEDKDSLPSEASDGDEASDGEDIGSRGRSRRWTVLKPNNKIPRSSR